MATAEAPPGVIGKLKLGSRISYWAISILVLILILALYYRAHNKKTFTPPKPASAASVEESGKSSVNQFLKSGDTEAYQVAESNLALQYLESNSVNDADRIMTDVFKKVPQEKIIDNSLYTMVEVQRRKGDNNQYKYYLKLLIAKLNSEGKTNAADQEQKVLDNIK